MPVDPTLETWLRDELKTNTIHHSGATLYDHLVGVATILKRWGATEKVWKAGLCHSVYGTDRFAHPSLDIRGEGPARLTAKIGNDAEWLTRLFCTLDRRSMHDAVKQHPSGGIYLVKVAGSNEAVGITQAELRDLTWILWANELEQAPRSPSTRGVAQLIAVAKPWLPVQAHVDLAVRFPVRSAVETLFGLKLGVFLQDFWPEMPCVATGDVGRLAGLVDSSLDAIIRLPRRYTQAFYGMKADSAACMNVTPGQERPLYDAGMTLYFHSLRSPSIDTWVHDIEEELNLVPGGTRVSAFASKRGRGLPVHYDMNDNIVCQASGAKRWRVLADHMVKWPTLGYRTGLQMTQQHRDEGLTRLPPVPIEQWEVIDMLPGNVMFMPRGIWHTTETTETESLHFNIQCGLPMWKDLIEFLIAESPAIRSKAMREPIKRLFESDTLSPEVITEIRGRLEKLAHDIGARDPKIDKAAFQRFLAARRGA